MNKTVTVYNFEVYDHTVGEMKALFRWSTRERIERIQGRIIEASAVDIDERLIDDDGRQKYEFSEFEAGRLRELRDNGGKGSGSGNWPHKQMDRLVAWGLVTRRAIAADLSDYALTPLGQSATKLL